MTSAKNIKNIVFDSIIRVVTKMPLALRDTVLDLRTSFPSRKAHHKVIPLYNEDEGLNSEIKDAVVDKNGEIILGDNIVRCWIEGKHQIKDLRRVDYVRLNDLLLVKNEGLFLDNHLMIEFTPTERTELMYIDYKEHKKARANYYSFRTNSRLFVSNDLISWKLIYAGKRGIKNSMVFVERSENTYLIFIEYTPGEVRERHKIIEYCFESEQISVSKEFYTCKEFLQDNSLPCCRHIHVIDKDPFTGNIYVGTGDNDFESAIWVSNDQGITYKKLYQDKSKFKEIATVEFEKAERDISEYDLDKIFEITAKNLDDEKLEFQDVTPYMYFKSKIIGISPNKHIMYVLIDEAQDYSLAQYRIISMLFRNSSVTLLGDLNQSILPFNHYDDYDGIVSTIGKFKKSPVTEKFELSKTYRSTYEINNFAKKVINMNNNYNQIDRHGDEVEVVKQNTFNAREILEESIKLKEQYNTVAIICKNIEETLLFKQEISNLENSSKFRMVTKNDNVFVEDKIMVIPSYLSKGLEFDAVIISNAGSDFYTEEERNLFYVVLTRALHKLKVYYTDKFTNLLDINNL